MTEGERRIDETLRTRLDQIETGYLERADENQAAIKAINEAYARFVRIASLILIVIAIVVGISGGISVYLLGQNTKRTQDIQNERRAAIIRECVSQNARHDRTLRQFDTEVERLRPTLNKRELSRLAGQKAANKRLIEALAPRQDCAKLVLERVGSG
jgi:hypothetical protein